LDDGCVGELKKRDARGEKTESQSTYDEFVTTTVSVIIVVIIMSSDLSAVPRVDR
jgi:hypothetical protein